MENQYKFKTSMKCVGCVGIVTPYLNEVNDIKEWDVDLKSPDRILTVTMDNDNINLVMDAVKKAGFNIEQIN